MRVGALSLMKCSKGGVLLSDTLNMDLTDFEDWIDAAREIEERIAKAMK